MARPGTASRFRNSRRAYAAPTASIPKCFGNRNPSGEGFTPRERTFNCSAASREFEENRMPPSSDQFPFAMTLDELMAALRPVQLKGEKIVPLYDGAR